MSLPDCVATQYNEKRTEWLSRLSGPAYEEAKRPLEEHLAIQRTLQQIGFLPATAKIDGVYSAATRAAIVAWQVASDRPATGILSDADAGVFRHGPPSGAVLALPSPPSDNSVAP